MMLGSEVEIKKGTLKPDGIIYAAAIETSPNIYTKGDKEKGLALGEAALKLDKRYATVTFLKDNLWGDRLISATQNFLATPEMKAALAKIQDAPPPPQ